MIPPITCIVLSVGAATRFTNVMEAIDTRKFYKVFFVASGSLSININDRLVVLAAGDIIFHPPGDRLYFQISENGNAYLCLVHTEYLSTHSPYLIDLFRHFPLYCFRRAIITLDNKQSAIARLSFESIIREQQSNHPDKKQAIVLQLQLIMLQIQRAGRKINRLYYANSSSNFSWFTSRPFSYS